MFAAGLTVLSFAGAGAASAHEEVRTLDGAGGVQGPTADPGANSNAGGNGNGGGQGGTQDGPNGGGVADGTGSDNAGGNGQGGGNPNGNNGTVKIRSAKTDMVDNEPKVSGCGFLVDWYNYGTGGHGTVEVSGVGQDRNVDAGGGSKDISADSATGAGNDTDSNLFVTPDTDGLEAHPIHGYHLTVTVTTTSSTGESQVKHKVIWFQPEGECGSSLDVDPRNFSEIVLDDVVDDTAVLGETLTQAPAPAPEVAPAPTVPLVQGEQLARTGALTDRLMQLAGALLVLGGLVFMAGGKQQLATSTRRR